MKYLIFLMSLLISQILYAEEKDFSKTRVSPKELWMVRCAKCHNLRHPEDFTEKRWDILILHMRSTANLTGDEQRIILEFLKSQVEEKTKKQ